jgi:hypothetical protein
MGKSDSKWSRTEAKSLAAVARSLWADERVRQKVMGRSLAVARSGARVCGLRFRGGDAGVAFALLDQHAGDHGVGVLVEILVEQGRNLLAQVGGVSKAGQLVALQSVLRSVEKELPGRLGALVVHGGLQYVRSNVQGRYNTSKNSVITSHRRVHSLWKSVENKENSLRACSGCAGDYEDPDRTAWEEGFEEEELEEVEA